MNQTPDARSKLECSASALRSNFRILADRAPGLQLLAMVKANAYGHGAAWVADQLRTEKRCGGFGVATLEEGAALRQALGSKIAAFPVIVFSGSTPFTDDVGQWCQKHQLTPVIASMTDWERFASRGWTAKLPYELKFQTGMHRLGLPWDAAVDVVRALELDPALKPPQSVFSHLAMSDRPSHPISRQQLLRFTALRELFLKLYPGMQFHLGNTGAIWNAKAWKLTQLTDLARPGIGLYGYLSDPGKSTGGLTPVMSFQAKVQHTFTPEKGARIGYGGQTTITRKGTYAAVLGAGYADGLPRASWKTGCVSIDKKPRRFLGVISMDLSVAECSASTQVGNWVELWGREINAWKLAQAAGTLPYELLTNVGKRSERIYVD